MSSKQKKHKKTKKKEIPGAKKALIVTTAVAKYLENKKKQIIEQERGIKEELFPLFEKKIQIKEENKNKEILHNF